MNIFKNLLTKVYALNAKNVQSLQKYQFICGIKKNYLK